MKMQEFLIRLLLNPLGRQMAKLPHKIRTAGFYLGGAGLFLIYFANAMEFFSVRYLWYFIAGSIFLGIMLLCSLPEELHPFRFSPLLSVCWFGAGLMMLQAGLRLNTDILSDAIMFLVVYPILWLIWGQGQFANVFRALCNLCRWAFVIYFSVSLLFFPISTAQYAGMFHNVNGAAFFFALALICLTVDLWQRKRCSFTYWMDLVLIGLASAMMFYTNSRTGELAIIGAWLLGGALYLWTIRKNLWHMVCGYVLPMILSVLLLVPSTVYLFASVSPVSRTLSRAAYSTIEKIGIPTEQINLWSNRDLPEKPSGISGFIDVSEEKGTIEDRNLDSYSTGRISIWKVFAQHTKLLGTEPPHNYHIEYNDKCYSTAHNTPLEYAINSGWICGVLYFLFNILAGLKSIRYARINRSKTYAMAPFMIAIAFGVCSMLGSLNTPYLYTITMYYFFVQTPLMAASPDRQVSADIIYKKGEKHE